MLETFNIPNLTAGTNEIVMLNPIINWIVIVLMTFIIVYSVYIARKTKDLRILNRARISLIWTIALVFLIGFPVIEFDGIPHPIFIGYIFLFVAVAPDFVSGIEGAASIGIFVIVVVIMFYYLIRYTSNCLKNTELKNTATFDIFEYRKPKNNYRDTTTNNGNDNDNST